jgi:mono/diheme cytochrome c family protein
MRLPHTLVLPIIAAACVLAFAVAASAATPTAVVVTATDTTLSFRPARAPVGTVALTIRNLGKRVHIVSIGDKTNKLLKAGATARLLVTFTSPRRVQGMSTAPGHAGSQTAVLTVTKAATGATDAGRSVFIQAGCGGCHTLRAANAAGIIGPNFDAVKPSIARIVDRVTNGYKGMPPFGGSLTTAEIGEVAAFVYSSTH